MRSSVKFRFGEDGPDAILALEDTRELDSVRVREPDLGPAEAFREEDSEEGTLGPRSGGCCRIRLNPEAPMPCSCSVIGVLKEQSDPLHMCSLQNHWIPRVPGRAAPSLQRFNGTPKTDLDIVSNSAANPASNENRTLDLSVGCACARRLPVLRFLGR